ncbi:hypothetical protein F4809DRAFT_646389 [Biscogniauxia mediterranea]|nr:hypothetical protein F4809DRAFT_646389 [Biscogniauxia mediterranea]
MAQSTSSSGPVICRPATGCKLERLVDSVKNAMAMNILDSEKPSMALAMLLLGGEVVYN